MNQSGSITDERQAKKSGPEKSRIDLRADKKDPFAIDRIEWGAALTRLTPTEFARQAVEAAYERVKVGLPIKGDDNPSDIYNRRLRYLSAVPCGPWQEAIDLGQEFILSQHVADEWEIQDGDVLVRADGQSMEGAGIHDGFVVLIRPYTELKKEARGHIVLVQSINEAGEYVSTLKRYNGLGGGKPKFLDGNDDPYHLPDDTVKVEIIGRALGVMGNL